MLLTLLACNGPLPPEIHSDDLPGPGEAAAGSIADDAVLFGGISAEGRRGALMLVNDRVRFVVQGVRDSGYYIRQGGGVLDADIVRPEGQPGRDVVDDWTSMVGMGRLLEPTQATVIDDGRDSGVARVRVEGTASAMELITGALETPSIIPEMDLWITVDYALPADSWLLEVTTTVSTDSETSRLEIGDLLQASVDAADPWIQGDGLDSPEGRAFEWNGFVGRHNEIALGLFAQPSEVLTFGAVGALLTSLVEMGLAFQDPVDLTPDSPISYSRLYGVGPDLATLTDEWLERSGGSTETVSGTVTAADGPVPGARVTILVDDAPYTLAFTDEDGDFSARVPWGSEVSWLADGRGPGTELDLPEGAGSWSPYAAMDVQKRVGRSFTDGAVAVPAARGRGFGTPEDPLTLQEPARLTVAAVDGAPFEARLQPHLTPARDPRLVMDRASGDRILAWSRDGEVTVPLEPGTYDLVVHRGPRFETWSSTLQVEAGDSPTVLVDLEEAWSIPGWWFGDPHMHAAPSGDGSISMEARLVGAAGLGVELHFGTDHDHVANYRPLVAALGLEDRLVSVVADEVSPVIRGHLNLYPLIPADEPNGGAWAWWSEAVPDTESQFERLREHHPGALIQANHPLDSGVAAAAGWSPGSIANADRWSTDFDCMEVLNADDHADYLALFWDLTNRGLVITPTGTSDSHGHTSGNPGLNGTLIGLGETYSDAALVEAMRAGRTVITHGPGLQLSIEPGSTVVGATELQVELLRASWVGVDSVQLWQDGELAESVTEDLDDPITFSLDPEADASFVVIAEGSEPLAPVWPGESAWAMSSPIRVDLAGDGWAPPLPPLELTGR